jgi:hypothetical protein
VRDDPSVTGGTVERGRRVTPAAVFGGYLLAVLGALALVLAVHDGTNAERSIAAVAVGLGLVAATAYLRRRGAWRLDSPVVPQRDRKRFGPLVGVAVLVVGVTNAAGTAVTAACLGLAVGAWLGLVALLTTMLVKKGPER